MQDKIVSLCSSSCVFDYMYILRVFWLLAKPCYPSAVIVFLAVRQLSQVFPRLYILLVLQGAVRASLSGRPLTAPQTAFVFLWLISPLVWGFLLQSVYALPFHASKWNWQVFLLLSPSGISSALLAVCHLACISCIFLFEGDSNWKGVSLPFAPPSHNLCLGPNIVTVRTHWVP